MISKTIKAFIKSYLLILPAGFISMFIILLLFNNEATGADDSLFFYFFISGFLIFFIPFPAALFFLLPLIIFEREKIKEADFSELIKRYLPIPVLSLSFVVCFSLLVWGEPDSDFYFYLMLLLQISFIILFQFINFIRQLTL